MPDQLMNVRIDVNTKVYLKDPNSSELGRQILSQSLPMIDQLGVEHFTFRKLAVQIGTTESSIYRYFENKHKLLLYYVSWYWGWVEYNIAFGTVNISDPDQRLKKALEIMTSEIKVLEQCPFDVDVLQHVIVSESSKAYMTKQVDDENKVGLFAQYKSLVNRLSQLILNCAPKYPYAHTLASLFVESQLDQRYFADHLPSLSDIGKDGKEQYKFYQSLIFNAIASWKK